MKKTLFLSAILGAALCSNAFGAIMLQETEGVIIKDMTALTGLNTLNASSTAEVTFVLDVNAVNTHAATLEASTYENLIYAHAASNGKPGLGITFTVPEEGDTTTDLGGCWTSNAGAAPTYWSNANNVHKALVTPDEEGKATYLWKPGVNQVTQFKGSTEESYTTITGLQTTNTSMQSITVNADYITSVTYTGKTLTLQDEGTAIEGYSYDSYQKDSYTYNNGKVAATIITNTATCMNKTPYEAVKAKGGDLVVTGTGQLYIDSYNGSDGGIADHNLTNNIILAGGNGQAGDKKYSVRLGSYWGNMTMSGAVTLLADATMYADAQNSNTFSGVVSGAGKTLSITGGTYKFTNSVELGTLSTNAGSVEFTTDNAMKSIMMDTNINITGGTTTIGRLNQTVDTNNFTSAISVSNATLQLGLAQNSSKTISGALTLGNGATLKMLDGGLKFTGATQLGSAATDKIVLTGGNWAKDSSIIELNGVISGSGSVYVKGAADNQKVTLSGGSNTFTGTYYVGVGSNGTKNDKLDILKLDHKDAAAKATVDLAGGDKAKLMLTTDTVNIATLNGVAGSTVTTTAAATTLNVGAGTFAGAISGAIGINKTGEGKLTLSGANTYTAVAVAGGTLDIDADVTVGGLTSTGGTITVQNEKTLTVNGTASYTGATQTRSEARTTTNGFGSTVAYANVIGGEGSVNSTAAWTLNDHEATLNGKELSYVSGATNVYYINTGDAITNITADHIGNEGGNITTNVNLVGDADTVGMKLTGTQTGATYTFSGAFTGTGNLVIEPTTPAADNLADTYVFSGAITHTGAIVATSNTEVVFNGDSTNITTALKAPNGHITAYYEHGKNVTVTGEINNNPWENKQGAIDLNVTDNTTVAFNGAVKADKLTVEEGSAAALNAESNLKDTVTVNGDLTVKAASTVKQLGGLGTVKALADLTVSEAKEGKVKLGGMEIAGNTTVTVNDHAGTLTLGSLTVTGSGSTINANLDLSGATVTLNGNSVELGCDLKFNGTAITLSDDDIAAISGAGLLLFSDVESLTLGTTTHNTDYIGLVDASGIILTLAGDATSELPDKVFVNFSATDKTVSLSVVPEPATATLSLLALAALASRRRRK